MKEAVLANHPIRGEKLLVRALQLGAARGDILAALMEEAVPRNCVDDHYYLYPNFAFMMLDAIGWEFAEPVLRSALRYITTVSPYGKDYHLEGKSFRETSFLGGKSDFERINTLAESHGLLKEGAVRDSPADPVAERAWVDKLAFEIAEDPPENVPGKKPGNVVFHRISEKIADALAKGMSLEGALDTVSIMAARFYIKQTVGNPMDTHMLNSIE